MFLKFWFLVCYEMDVVKFNIYLKFVKVFVIVFKFCDFNVELFFVWVVGKNYWFKVYKKYDIDKYSNL